MNLFYNSKGVGDATSIQVELSVGPFEYEQRHDVAEIKKESEAVGYNTFNVSNNVAVNGNGRVKLITELIRDLQQLITEVGLDHQPDTDVSPKFAAGYVEAREKHPNADKLSVLNISIDTKKFQIVCGAPNVEFGQKAVVAKVGAVMSSGTVVRDVQLCRVDSSGMICSVEELNLPNAPKEEGIMVLNDDYDIDQALFE